MSSLLDWLVENDPAFRKSRLPSLYSDLVVQKTTNPEGYATNIVAWRNALTRAATAGQLPTEQQLVLQSSEDLLNALASPQYGRPSGLGLVLDDAVHSGQMIDVKDFRTSEHSIYERSWIPSPWTVLKWGLKQAGLGGGSSYDRSGSLRPGQLVLVPALEEAYKQIMAAHSRRGASPTDRVMTRDVFANDLAKLNNERLSQQDTDLLLQYLHRDKRVLSYDSQTIKFVSDPSSNDPPPPITTEDTTIANLKTLIQNLTAQTTTLTARIATLQMTAKTAVTINNKAGALSALRSKKLAERTLSQRADTLAQLEEVLTKIEAAVDQVAIVEVMQSSTAALRTLNRKVGGVERVEDVVMELREEMGKVDEVGGALREPLDGNAVVDEAEVDDELEAMEKEEREKAEEKEAQEARKRLAELDTMKDDRALEDSLRSSMERLDKLKLDGQVTEGVQNEDKQEGEQRQREPEQAS